MNWNWLIGPLVGAFIGYFTNHVALRMLFRPHRALYIGKWRLPFTPGLIPKGRGRLSRAVRDLLDTELLSADVLQQALLSEKMLAKMDTLADETLTKLLQEEKTPRMALDSLFGDDKTIAFEAEVKRQVVIFIMEKILQSGIEKLAAEAALTELKERLKGTAAAPLMFLLDDKRSAAMEEKLSQTIREMVATHAPNAMEGMLDTMLHDGLDTPIGTLLSQYDARKDSVRHFLIEVYTELIKSQLAGILAMLDLGTIVEEKLSSLDNAELENIIVQITNQELRAIEWLGALLGAVIGLVNAFF